MSRLFALILSISLVACAVANSGEVVKPMIINKLSKPFTHIKIGVDGLLTLKGVSISNWPIPLPDCDDCEVNFQRHFLPQGPEKIVKLVGKQGNLKLLVVDAKRKSKSTSGWAFELLSGSALKVCYNAECAELMSGQIKTIAGCKVNVPWVSIHLPKTGIADSAQSHFQTIVACP